MSGAMEKGAFDVDDKSGRWGWVASRKQTAARAESLLHSTPWVAMGAPAGRVGAA